MMDDFAHSVGFLSALHFWQSVIVYSGILISEKIISVVNFRAHYWITVIALIILLLAPLIIFLPGITAFNTTGGKIFQIRLSAHIYDLTWIGILFGLIWVSGIVLYSLKLIQSFIYSKKLMKSALQLPTSTACSDFAKVVTSNQAVSPMVLGFANPVIVIPNYLTEEASKEYLRGVIAHEEHHILQRDIWFSLCEAIIQVIYWWNPILTRIISKIHLFREIICDEHVVNSNIDPIAYAKILTITAQYVRDFNQVATKHRALFSSQFGVEYRVRTLIQKDCTLQKKAHYVWPRLLFMACIITSLILLLFLTTPRAQYGSQIDHGQSIIVPTNPTAS